MNKRFCLLLSGLLLACGCAPRLFRYGHVVVQQAPRLSVITRSTESNDTQGKPLRGAKVGLPITSVVSSADYSVGIYTPLQLQPLVFLRAEDAAKNPLQLRGSNIRELEKRAGVRVVLGYTHTFDLSDTSRGQIEFEVVNGIGRVLGQEKIGYEVVTRGYHWDMDTL